MENNYICKYELYHDKPCKEDYSPFEPSSNNGWIYTAYAQALGHLTASTRHYQKLYDACLEFTSNSFYIDRLPNKTEPPISRDEAIGMHYLRTPIFIKLHQQDFYLCYSGIANSVSWIDSIKALWKIRNEHRNFVWQNEVFDAYKLAFKLMPHDVYYFKKSFGFSTNITESILFNLYAFSTIVQNNISARNVLWLQLKDLNSKFWIKFINQPKNFKKYFGDNHPFVKGE